MQDFDQTRSTAVALVRSIWLQAGGLPAANDANANPEDALVAIGKTQYSFARLMVFLAVIPAIVGLLENIDPVIRSIFVGFGLLFLGISGYYFYQADTRSRRRTTQ